MMFTEYCLRASLTAGGSARVTPVALSSKTRPTGPRPSNCHATLRPVPNLRERLTVCPREDVSNTSIVKLVLQTLVRGPDSIEAPRHVQTSPTTARAAVELSSHGRRNSQRARREAEHPIQRGSTTPTSSSRNRGAARARPRAAPEASPCLPVSCRCPRRSKTTRFRVRSPGDLWTG